MCFMDNRPFWERGDSGGLYKQNVLQPLTPHDYIAPQPNISDWRYRRDERVKKIVIAPDGEISVYFHSGDYPIGKRKITRYSRPDFAKRGYL